MKNILVVYQLSFECFLKDVMEDASLVLVLKLLNWNFHLLKWPMVLVFINILI
jgi:hypothetical protein